LADAVAHSHRARQQQDSPRERPDPRHVAACNAVNIVNFWKISGPNLGPALARA
jgi:hypothetical protein